METAKNYHKIFSSIGFGTYLGKEDDTTDTQYFDSIIGAVEHGCTVIDTAINYRGMKSERVVGRAIEHLEQEDPNIREKLIIASKGGFIPYDAETGENPSEYVLNRFFDTGILQKSDIVMGCHSLNPEYIRECVRMSLQNLGLEYIDIYYIHNPEMQLSEVPPGQFYQRLTRAFEVLEGFVREGRIGMYGTATWDGFRADADNPERMSIKHVFRAAGQTSAGKQHHFRVIQLPVNIYMPEAAVKRNQELEGTWVSTLDAANALGIFVMTSATLLQTHALKNNRLLAIPELNDSGDSMARRAIQIVRSLSGVTTALVGMKTVRHMQENVQLLSIPKLKPEEALRVLAAL